MKIDDLKPNVIVRGPIFPEPVQVIATVPIGQSIRLLGKGTRTNLAYDPVLSPEQLDQLESIHERFDGDASRFRLGIEALRLGLAYEYDPYFAVDCSRRPTPAPA